MCAQQTGSAANTETQINDCSVELRGHLIDTGLIDEVYDLITGQGGSFEVEVFQPGVRRDQESTARIRVLAPDAARLQTIVSAIESKGGRVVGDDSDARLEPAAQDGVAPVEFYSTTIFPTDVRIGGSWIHAQKQRMDVVLVVKDTGPKPEVACTLIRDIRSGDLVVCGAAGIRIHPVTARQSDEAFSFMSSGVSSERRVEVAAEETAREMQQIHDRGGRIVVVAGPVVVHTGGSPHLARLVREGYVQALLGGNAIAVHDMEQAIYGTSLGVDLNRGVGVHGGHRHHLKVINNVRARGSIAATVEAGDIRSGIMYECVKNKVPFVLAGSIRDDGPLPETIMDLIEAQREYARAIEGADLILMLCSMLHSIGTGNMTPSGVRLICVDISPAVVTKLADRGSVESVGIVTDVGLFLNMLAGKLCPV